jgi:hypothetical protein
LRSNADEERKIRKDCSPNNLKGYPFKCCRYKI